MSPTIPAGARICRALPGASVARLSARLAWLARTASAALLLTAGLAQAQEEAADLPAPPSFTQPCTSAKAVHDMRCPNYTGFKNRVGAPASALPPAPSDPAPAPAARAGRELGKGVASWYGPGFHGRRTANGERFDENALTAAHKTLPFGTRVLVHNPRNGKQVVVRINDRGPFVRGRVIDVSRAAARALGMKQAGHVPVVLREALPERSKQRVASAD